MLLGRALAVAKASPARPMVPIAATRTTVRTSPVRRETSVPAAIVALARPRLMRRRLLCAPGSGRADARSRGADDAQRGGLVTLSEGVVTEDRCELPLPLLEQGRAEDVPADVVDVDDGHFDASADQALEVRRDLA